MEISIRQEQNSWVFSVAGKLDALTAPAYEQALDRLMADGANRVIVDFSALEFISSAGLRALLNTTKPMQERGGKLIYAALQGAVWEVFEMTGLLTVFEVCDSLEQAFDAT